MIDNKQQWFFLILIALWLVLSIIAPAVAFCITHKLLTLTGYIDLTPPAYLLYRLGNRLFPPGDNETKIAIAKQKNKKGHHIKK